jgi:hypothetical protein
MYKDRKKDKADQGERAQNRKALVVKYQAV